MNSSSQSSMEAIEGFGFEEIRVEAAKTLLHRRTMRDHLAPFISRVFKAVDPGSTFKPNWHIDLMAEALEACTQGKVKRLIINIPPRHLKSICVSIAWPAWLLGLNPSEQILCSSYSASLSLRHSVYCRQVIQAEWYRALFPGVDMVGDMNQKSEFMTTAMGHRIATSTGGSATGKGGKFLIVDDPVNPEQALSTKEREGANNWLDQTYATRLNDEKAGVIVVVMQRLHPEDLTGHLLAKGGWEHICIPQVAEAKTIIDFGSIKITREPGDLIQPERMGVKEVEAKKQQLGSYAWAGQYQQSPSPLGGGLIKIKWFKRYKVAPVTFRRIIQSWDTASKDKAVNDPSVCITVGETDTGFYILDVFKDRMVYPKLRRTALSLFVKWRPDVVLIEDKSSGQSLIQDLREDKLKPPVIAIQPCGDKITRMSTSSPVIEAGYCYLPEVASWLPDYEVELSNFPNVTHDDQSDSTSQFLNWVKRPGPEPQIRTL